MNKLLTLTLISIFALNSVGVAQNQLPNNETEQIKREYQFLKEQNALLKEDYKKIIEEKDKVIIAATNERINLLNKVYWGAIVLGFILSLFTFLGFKIFLQRSIKQIEKKTRKSISRNFKSLYEKFSEEEHVKNMLNIIAVYHTAEKAEIENFFGQNDINVRCIKLEIFLNKKFRLDKNKDVLFFWDEDKFYEPNFKFIHHKLDEFTKLEVAVFYFGRSFFGKLLMVTKDENGKTIEDTVEKKYPISGYANSRPSIYHNLIDLMRYKYYVIDGNHPE